MSNEEKKAAVVAPPENPVTVRVENLGKKFGSFKALDQISFQIQKGEILGFLGPNGAGKTTTMRILAGFFPPSSGKVFVLGQDLFKNPQKIKRQIGYLPESVSLYGEMKTFEFLEFVAKLKSVPRKKRRQHINDQIDRCGLGDVSKRLIGNLSKGFRQRIGLAQALIGNPEVLILDEPTNGLDPKQIIEIRTLIRELGKERTLILSTHILPEVSMICDRVLIINQGRMVASGTTDELGAGLQAGHEIFLTIGERHRKEEALQLLAALKGIEKIGVTEERGDRVSFNLTVAKGIELRPEISRIFVEHKLPILEIRSGRLSLEEIFLKLVVHENQGGGEA